MQDEAIQDVRIETPGAKHARCNVYIEDLHYRYNPPETLTVVNTKEDMIIKCKAPGNRNKELVISPKVTSSTYLNVTNGILPGLGWDALSGAMYYYPDVIEVDFTDVRVKSMPLPSYNDPNIKQPEDYNLEEFKPTHSRLNSDRYETATPLKRRVFQKPIYSQSPYGVEPVAPLITEESVGIVEGSDASASAQTSVDAVINALKYQGAVITPVPVSDSAPSVAPVTAKEAAPAATAPMIMVPSPALVEDISAPTGNVTLEDIPISDEPVPLIQMNSGF